MSYIIHSDVLPARLTLVGQARLDVREVAGWLHRTYGELFSYIASRDVVVTGPPFGRYAFDEDERHVAMEAGVPVAAPVAAGGNLVMSSLPATTAATTCHVGPYDRLVDACGALDKWIHDRGFERAGPHWEVYLSDPVAQPDSERLRTVVIMPYRAPVWASGDVRTDEIDPADAPHG